MIRIGKTDLVLGRLIGLSMALLLLLLLANAGAAQPRDFKVNSTLDLPDVNPGDGRCRALDGACTLRAAIQEANALDGLDIIVLRPGSYVLTIDDAYDGSGATGGLLINGDTEIRGAGADKTVVDGNGKGYSTFTSTAASSAVFSDLTVQNGGGEYPNYGGFSNAGMLTLSNVTVGRTFGGGGVQNSGALTAISVTLAENWGFHGGGGLWNSGNATLTDVAIIDNGTSEGDGGGILNDASGTVVVTNATIAHNSGFLEGGGIKNDGGSMTLTNVTLSGNYSNAASGGISNYDMMTLINSTIIDNWAPFYMGSVATQC